MSAAGWRTLAALGFVGALGCAAAVAAAGCAPAPASSPDAPPIATVHRHQCGRCHSPPESSSHTRAELEDAFSRHHSRVHLTPDEWAAMVDYLASPSGSAALH